MVKSLNEINKYNGGKTMTIKGKTIQEHIWNDLNDLENYSTWDWVNVFYHFGLDLNEKNYKKWVKEMKEEGTLYERKEGLKE